MRRCGAVISLQAFLCIICCISTVVKLCQPLPDSCRRATLLNPNLGGVLKLPVCSRTKSQISRLPLRLLGQISQIMSKRSLIFAASTSTCTYSLLALPSPILALLRSNHSDPSTAPNLEIRGHGTDAAVLVTKDQTFSIRGVQNSNSLLLCDTEGKLENGRREEDAFMLNDDAISSGRPRKKRKLDEIVIETTLHETLELAGSIPRFDKLYNVLSRIEYDGEDGEVCRS